MLDRHVEGAGNHLGQKLDAPAIIDEVVFGEKLGLAADPYFRQCLRSFEHSFASGDAARWRRRCGAWRTV